uniref:Uncharacterized protein n=1 Tax=Oreochromis aureus TaxID=47969 RepID=A0A668TFN2_OREAU
MTHLTSPEPSNPWTSDDTTFWDLEASKEPSKKRVKWGFSLEEALKDPPRKAQVLAGCTGVKEGASTGSCTEALYQPGLPQLQIDSYSRFLQSNLYQELLMVRKKPETDMSLIPSSSPHPKPVMTDGHPFLSLFLLKVSSC